MPVVEINPNNSGTIKLGNAAAPIDEYGCQVINFKLESVAITKERAGTYCAPPATLNSASKWQVSFQYLQDWGAVKSISQFMFDNDGKEVFFEFSPDPVAFPDVPKSSGSFMAQAGSYGGDAGTTWDFSGTCGMTAPPTLTAPVAAADAAALYDDDDE
jgi:hypothetical protein